MNSTFKAMMTSMVFVFGSLVTTAAHAHEQEIELRELTVRFHGGAERLGAHLDCNMYMFHSGDTCLPEGQDLVCTGDFVAGDDFPYWCSLGYEQPDGRTDVISESPLKIVQGACLDTYPVEAFLKSRDGRTEKLSPDWIYIDAHSTTDCMYAIWILPSS